MTREEIENSNSTWLTPEDVAWFFETNPQSLRHQAQDDPSKLGCEVVVIGNRTKFPRVPFINYMNHVKGEVKK